MKRESNTKGITVNEFAPDQEGDWIHTPCGRIAVLTNCDFCGSEWCFGYYCSKCGSEGAYDCEEPNA